MADAGNPAELLAELIRFDTSNPPGNERECIAYIEGLLSEAGLETKICAAEPDRPNLIARLRGRGAAPPLLLQGHVDVVPADESEWQHPPFAGKVIDDYVWGRGALDMKGGVAMMIGALLRGCAEREPPRGDVIFAALSDEERGSGVGARYLVENQPELFEGVRYAIGEFGGYTLHLAGRRFYPIQVAEKQTCQLKAIVRGPGGHGSMPRRDGTMARLGTVLERLNRERLPQHISPVVRRMVQEISGSVLPPAGPIMAQLFRSPVTDLVLRLPGDIARIFEPLLHNTAVPTIVRAGEKENVIPSQATVTIDGRLVPGQTPDDLLRELGDVVGDEVELRVVAYDAAGDSVDYGLYELLSNILEELDPGSVPIPVLLPGVTDGRLFARLGIQSYGFIPLRLDPGFSFIDTIHAADERVPVKALEFGTRALTELLTRYGS